MPDRRVLAVAAHPDDVEFMMAGTLLQLGAAGFELHVMNIADGSCGSMTEGRQETRSRRVEEARAAADVMGATLHEPIAEDLNILYVPEQLQRVAAVVRSVAPDIVLTHSPNDYMEDHMNACRLAQTAAFVRAMPNFVTSPAHEPVDEDVTLYHAQPHGLRDPLRRIVVPGLYVDITEAMDRKRQALGCHISQKDWLDETQGMGSYIGTMEDMSRRVGDWSGIFEYAEGWRRHLHFGYCDEDADPLRDALGNKTLVNEEYEEALEVGDIPKNP